MHKTKTFKFTSFTGYEHNPILTREAALIIGAELIAWSQSLEEKESKPPAEPRLWVGEPSHCQIYWRWDLDIEGWCRRYDGLRDLVFGDIFAPPTGSKPVGDPTKLDSLPLCREVDWDVE